jgi:hypothetical protein
MHPARIPVDQLLALYHNTAAGGLVGAQPALRDSAAPEETAQHTTVTHHWLAGGWQRRAHLWRHQVSVKRQASRDVRVTPATQVPPGALLRGGAATGAYAH